MSVVARLTVLAQDFILADVIDSTPSVRVRLEAFVPTMETIIPYIRIRTDDFDRVAAALGDSSDIETFEVVGTNGEQNLVRIRWSGGGDRLLDVLSVIDAQILEGECTAEEWSLLVRFDDRESLSECYHECRERGISIDIEEINDAGLGEPTTAPDLTDPQREALRIAYKHGYFEVPRKASLTELADDLGVSDTATSQRIRRGLLTLIQTWEMEQTT